MTQPKQAANEASQKNGGGAQPQAKPGNNPNVNWHEAKVEVVKANDENKRDSQEKLRRAKNEEEKRKKETEELKSKASVALTFCLT